MSEPGRFAAMFAVPMVLVDDPDAHGFLLDLLARYWGEAERGLYEAAYKQAGPWEWAVVRYRPPDVDTGELPADDWGVVQGVCLAYPRATAPLP